MGCEHLRHHHHVGAAGVLLLVPNSRVSEFEARLRSRNARGRVSDEMLSLHLVKPTRSAVRALALQMRGRQDLAHLEKLPNLKANNALKDLTSGRKLSEHTTSHYHIMVGLETVTCAWRHKYPHPNLTLPAGRVKPGEALRDAAVREFQEETGLTLPLESVRRFDESPIRLMGGGMLMYVCVYTEKEEKRGK